MNDAINHLKMAAADYRRMTTPNPALNLTTGQYDGNKECGD